MAKEKSKDFSEDVVDLKTLRRVGKEVETEDGTVHFVYEGQLMTKTVDGKDRTVTVKPTEDSKRDFEPFTKLLGALRLTGGAQGFLSISTANADLMLLLADDDRKYARVTGTLFPYTTGDGDRTGNLEVVSYDLIPAPTGNVKLSAEQASRLEALKAQRKS